MCENFWNVKIMPTVKSKKKFLDPEVNSPLEQRSINRFLWLKGNFAYCMAISALIWIVGICYYIQHFIGWGSIFALNPSDFGIFSLTVTLPIFLMWFILAYIERSSSLDANALLFQLYINNLLYPDDDASLSAKAISSVLQNQLSLLQKESKQVLSQSSQLKSDLENRISELSDILKLLDSYSAKTLVDLNDGVKKLSDRCSYITDKATESALKLKNCSSDITQNSDKFLSKMVPVLDELSALSSNIKGNIVDNKNNLSVIRDQLNSCADLSQQYVQVMMAKTTENTQRIERAFLQTAEEYDSLYKRLDTSISGIEGRVEEQRRLIQTQTQVINHNSDLINNKLSKYGKKVSEEIDKLVKNSVELEKMTKKQVSTLKAVNTETRVAVNNIGDVFDEKRLEIERRCEYAISSMQNVILAINKETEKLMSFTNLTQAKNHDLQSISETIVDKIGDISNKLALKTDTLKEKAVDVIEKFTEASELINRGTEKINTSSNLIVNNSRQGVKLLEEQNFYITNALTNIDAVKEKLAHLHTNIVHVSAEITQTLNSYEKHIDQVDASQEEIVKINPEKPDFDREKLISTSNSINRTLRNLGINSEKLYEKQDLFALWDSYLEGNQSAFTDVISLGHKQTSAIRKTFDDNASFHNQVIRYLFLMDLVIKEMLSPTTISRDELVNLSINASLDKIYFILVKALNSAD